MYIEIGNNLSFVISIISIAWALAYAFKAYHNAHRD